MSHWETYKPIGTVQAARITAVGTKRGGYPCITVGTESFRPTNWRDMPAPRVGDYAVIEADGFRTIIQREDFEADYAKTP